MELDDIRLFVRVAQLKSFVKAARDLRLQTSSLSRRVARLEAEMGVRLLHRTTRQVSLTEEGERFLAETAGGLEQLRSAVDSLQSLHGAPQGLLRIASPIDLGQFLLETIMPDFFKEYPGIRIEWDHYSAFRSLVEMGVDLAIRPVRSLEQSLIEKKVGQLQFQMFRAPSFKLPFSRRPTVADLEALPWLVFTRGSMDAQPWKMVILLDGKETEIHPKNIRFRTNSFTSIRYALVNGLGVGLLPSPMSRPEVALGRLEPVLPRVIRGLSTEFYAVYPSKTYLAPKVRVMIDWLSKNFPSDQRA